MSLQSFLLSSNNPAQARLMAAGPDLTLAAIYLVTWIAPYTLGQHVVRYLVFTLVFEFVILHSAAVLVAILLGRFSRGTSRTLLVLLSLYYLIFAGGFAVIVGAWWPLVSFAVLTVNRMTTLRHHETSEARERLQWIVGWAFTLALYVTLWILVAIVPIPALGITETVAEAQLSDGGGEFAERPQVALAFGFLYYLTIGCADLFDYTARFIDKTLTTLRGLPEPFVSFLRLVYRLLFRRERP